MKPSSMGYALRDALRSMWRNKFMSLASMATVAISLTILGFAWLLVVNTQYLTSVMEAELEINVYLQEKVTREQALELKSAFAQIPGVTETVFVPKEEGLKNLEERFGAESDLVKVLGDENPLPDVYRLKTTDAAHVPQAAAAATGIQGVEDVRYGKGMVEKLLSLTQWLQMVGVIAILAVGLAAVFLIATTIRITVFARRREVAIMKLVGATDWYIRWPFFLEGMIIGFIGALCAVVCIYLFYNQLVKNIALTISFLPIMTDRSVLINLYQALLLMGTALGALGSAISLHRFLKI